MEQSILDPLIVRADAHTGVAHLADEPVGLDGGSDLDLAGGCELRSVVEQQEEDLADLREIGADAREGLRDLRRDAQRLLAEPILDAEDCLVDELAEVDVLDLDGQLALLDAPEVEDALKTAW